MVQTASATGAASNAKIVYIVAIIAVVAAVIVVVLAVFLFGKHAQPAAKTTTTIPSGSTTPQTTVSQGQPGSPGGALLMEIYAPGPLNSSKAEALLTTVRDLTPVNASYTMQFTAKPYNPVYPTSAEIRYWRIGDDSHYFEQLYTNNTPTMFNNVYLMNGSVSECPGHFYAVGINYTCDNNATNMSDEIFLDPMAFRYYNIYVTSATNTTWDGFPATFANGTMEELSNGVTRKFAVIISDQYLVPLVVGTDLNTSTLSLSELATFNYINSNVSLGAVVRGAKLTTTANSTAPATVQTTSIPYSTSTLNATTTVASGLPSCGSLSIALSGGYRSRSVLCSWMGGTITAVAGAGGTSHLGFNVTGADGRVYMTNGTIYSCPNTIGRVALPAQDYTVNVETDYAISGATCSTPVLNLTG